MLSPLFIMMLLETLPREIRSGCLEEICYPDDSALFSESPGSLKEVPEVWKAALELKRLRVKILKYENDN